MEKRFSTPVFYEKNKKQKNKIFNTMKIYFYQILKIFIVSYLFKIYKLISIKNYIKIILL